MTELLFPATISLGEAMIMILLITLLVISGSKK